MTGWKGTGNAGWRLVVCPRCKAPKGEPCVRVDGSDIELTSRHEARKVLGNLYKDPRRTDR